MYSGLSSRTQRFARSALGLHERISQSHEGSASPHRTLRADAWWSSCFVVGSSVVCRNRERSRKTSWRTGERNEGRWRRNVRSHHAGNRNSQQKCFRSHTRSQTKQKLEREEKKRHSEKGNENFAELTTDRTSRRIKTKHKQKKKRLTTQRNRANETPLPRWSSNCCQTSASLRDVQS